MRALVGRLRARARREGADRGSATVFVVGFAVLFLVLAGLVIDGGMAINARQRVNDDVEQAARAGSQKLNMAVLRNDGTVEIAPDAAAGAAAAFMRTRHYPDDDVEITASTAQVTVTATLKQPTALLSLIYIKSFTVQATGRARPAVGITGEDTP